MSWRLTLVKDQPNHVAYLESDHPLDELLTWEELERLHTQVSDIWRLAHAARRAAQAKEDLL